MSCNRLSSGNTAIRLLALLPLALLALGLMRLDGEYVKQWGELMAPYTISSIPLVLLFLFTMRFFAKGLTAGAVKG